MLRGTAYSPRAENGDLEREGEEGGERKDQKEEKTAGGIQKNWVEDAQL